MTDAFTPVDRDTAPWVDVPPTAGRTAAGYPVHRAVSCRQWCTPFRVRFVDWRAFCGAEGSASSWDAWTALKDVLVVGREELCPTCYPTRDWHHPAREETER